jgi:hypothetical protein
MRLGSSPSLTLESCEGIILCLRIRNEIRIHSRLDARELSLSPSEGIILCLRIWNEIRIQSRLDARGVVPSSPKGIVKKKM